MLRWPRPHQLRGGVVSDPSRRLGRYRGSPRPICTLSLSAFSQKASTLAEAVFGFRGGRRQGPAACRLDRGALHAGAAEGLAGDAWHGGHPWRNFPCADPQPVSMVTQIAIALGVSLWRERFS